METEESSNQVKPKFSKKRQVSLQFKKEKSIIYKIKKRMY